MKKRDIILLTALVGLAASCSKESPFIGESGSEETGQLAKSALEVDVRLSNLIEVKKGSATRATERPAINTGDFNMVFTREGASSPAARYKFSEMPEVVTLPAGKYTCTATIGENRNAAWDSPYVVGRSETFEVKAGGITSTVAPIECRLENVMVTVDFSALLRESMSKESYVDIQVGDDVLRYTLDEVDNNRAGYFRHSGETTIVATFNGDVDGQPTSRTYTQTNVQKGNHYLFTFRMHRHDGESEGGMEGTVTVDATVDVTNVDRGIPVDEDPVLDDNERPREDGDDLAPADKAPEIKANKGIDIDGVNVMQEGSEVVLTITSFADAGITKLTCDIISEKLTPAELATVGLSDHLDLVNTDAAMIEPLTNLGFPVNVGGQKLVTFNLTKFVPLMKALGACEHKFKLTVEDANGETVKTLTLKFN